MPIEVRPRIENLLYRTTLSPEQSSLRYPDRYVIPQGELHVFPFKIVDHEAVVVAVAQIAKVQDHSLRIWASRLPNGEAVPFEAVWHANRQPLYEKIAFVRNGTVPMTKVARTFELPAGYWYLNILNLINSPNSYELTFER